MSNFNIFSFLFLVMFCLSGFMTGAEVYFGDMLAAGLFGGLMVISFACMRMESPKKLKQEKVALRYDYV